MVHSTIRFELNAAAAPSANENRACGDKDDGRVTASIGG
jgi:hypothetical protein